MIPRAPFRYPEKQAACDRRAVRLEYWTLFFLATIVIAMYFSLGGSQAMRTAWLEDLLGFIPPIAFLVAHRVRQKPPDQAFPFGYYQASSIAYLVASTAILLLGLYIIGDAAMKLIATEHPTIGLVSLFGFEFWMGWLMIATLAYSVIPPVILGRMKLTLAREIADNTLLADAQMQKADWMTALAAIVGIVGIGFGFWWADAVAATLIALDVVHDGGRHTWHALRMLSDEAPRPAAGGSQVSQAVDRARLVLEALDWVEGVGLRLREEGVAITGVALVTPRPGTADLPERLEQARRAVEKAHWRLYDVQVVPRAKHDQA